MYELTMCWYTMLISLIIFEIWTYFHNDLGHLSFLFCEVGRFDRVDYIFPKLILHCSNSPWISSLIYGLIFILFIISLVVFWQVFMLINFIKFVLWCHVFFQNFQFYFSHWGLCSMAIYLCVVSYRHLIVPVTSLDKSFSSVLIFDATSSYTKSL